MSECFSLEAPRAYAIMASGTGSNALAIIDQGIEVGRPAAFVIVNKKSSPLLQEVPKRSIPIFYIASSVRGVDKKFEEEVVKKCREYQVNWLFLAGFMKILGVTLLENFKNQGAYQIINIHPSLLPKYPGLGGYQQAYEAEDSFYGHTLHLVDEGLDQGAILYQKKMELKLSETLESIIESGKVNENLSYRKLLVYMLRDAIVLRREESIIKAQRLPLDNIESNEGNSEGYIL